MRPIKYIHQIALGYVIAPIIIGLLFMFGPSFAPGPLGDCYDDEWSKVPGAHSITQRAAIIHHYYLIAQIGAGIMLGIGIVVLALLILGNWRGKPQSIFLLCAVFLMMAGYGFVIWAASGQPCGSFR
jgi:hypothetical protein